MDRQQPLADTLPTHLASLFASPSQARVEAWGRVLTLVRTLADHEDAGARQAVLESLSRLRPFERLWKWPGQSWVLRLDQFIRAGEGRTAVLEVERMMERLGAVGGIRATVLVVDAQSEEAFESLRQGLEVLQRGATPAYDLLHVRSLEEAWLATLLNDDIRACLIREEIPLRAEEPLPILGPALALALRRVEEGVEPAGFRLAAILRPLRPWLGLYLLGDESSRRLNRSTYHLFDRVLCEHQATRELHQALLEVLPGAGLRELPLS